MSSYSVEDTVSDRSSAGLIKTSTTWLPEERDEVRNCSGTTVGRQAREGPKARLVLITSVSEHRALFPASSHGAYPVSPRGAWTTVHTSSCPASDGPIVLFIHVLPKTQVPGNGQYCTGGAVSCATRQSVAWGRMSIGSQGIVNDWVGGRHGALACSSSCFIIMQRCRNATC